MITFGPLPGAPSRAESTRESGAATVSGFAAVMRDLRESQASEEQPVSRAEPQGGMWVDEAVAVPGPSDPRAEIWLDASAAAAEAVAARQQPVAPFVARLGSERSRVELLVDPTAGRTPDAATQPARPGADRAEEWSRDRVRTKRRIRKDMFFDLPEAVSRAGTGVLRDGALAPPQDERGTRGALGALAGGSDDRVGLGALGGVEGERRGRASRAGTGVLRDGALAPPQDERGTRGALGALAGGSDDRVGLGALGGVEGERRVRASRAGTGVLRDGAFAPPQDERVGRGALAGGSDERVGRGALAGGSDDRVAQEAVEKNPFVLRSRPGRRLEGRAEALEPAHRGPSRGTPPAPSAEAIIESYALDPERPTWPGSGDPARPASKAAREVMQPVPASPRSEEERTAVARISPKRVEVPSVPATRAPVATEPMPLPEVPMPPVPQVLATVAPESATPSGPTPSAFGPLIRLEAVPEQIRSAFERGSRELRMRLDPPELGGLEVKLAVEGKDVRLLIRAEHPDAANVLQHGLYELRSQLAQVGLNLVDVEVSHRGDGDERGEKRRDHSAAEEQESGENRVPKRGTKTSRAKDVRAIA